MAQYPRTQSNVTAQVESMIAGFTSHPEDFPHADIPALQAARDEFMAASDDFLNTRSQANLAADRKLEKFKRLSAIMKRQIKMAQADCADKPAKLSQMCWGPKADPSPVEVPSSPTNLKIIAQEGTTVFLSWAKPARRQGAPVRMYVIERRVESEDIWNWQLAGNSYNPEAVLKNQPTGVKMEYRVRASNAAGESFPSNTVCVVL
jgi:hypothetical protein